MAPRLGQRSTPGAARSSTRGHPPHGVLGMEPYRQSETSSCHRLRAWPLASGPGLRCAGRRAQPLCPRDLPRCGGTRRKRLAVGPWVISCRCTRQLIAMGSASQSLSPRPPSGQITQAKRRLGGQHIESPGPDRRDASVSDCGTVPFPVPCSGCSSSYSSVKLLAPGGAIARETPGLTIHNSA